jgi:hypothetical protein
MVEVGRLSELISIKFYVRFLGLRHSSCKLYGFMLNMTKTIFNGMVDKFDYMACIK